MEGRNKEKGKLAARGSGSILCIYLKYGCHSQTLYLSYAQLEEVMSWNTSVGFAALTNPSL